MSLHKNIFAFTAPGSEYPEYISINDTLGAVTLCARGAKKPADDKTPFVMPGDGATVRIPREQIPALIAALQTYIDGPRLIPERAPRGDGSWTFPRRNCVDLLTPAEKAIYDAMGVLEGAGAHPLLTDATSLLQRARDKVADYVEGARKF